VKNQEVRRPDELRRQPVGRWTDCSRRRWRVLSLLALPERYWVGATSAAKTPGPIEGAGRFLLVPAPPPY
jgi:hypothetical protein